MKYGHVTGTKRERTGASDWYRQIEEEHIRRIETQWQAKEQVSDEYYPESDGDLIPWDRAA